MYSHPAARTLPDAAAILQEYQRAKADPETLPATLQRLWNSYLEAVKSEMERHSDGESNIA